MPASNQWIFWSSSPSPNDVSAHWIVYFHAGYVQSYNAAGTKLRALRPLSGGRERPPGNRLFSSACSRSKRLGPAPSLRLHGQRPRCAEWTATDGHGERVRFRAVGGAHGIRPVDLDALGATEPV